MAEKVATMPISADDKRFQKNKWIFSISGIGRDMSYQLISAFLLTYIQFANTLTWEQFTFIGLFIGVAGRVWDAINDPMMGAIIEGSHMKFGKFKPWIMIGALSCGVVIMCIFGIQMFSGWGFVAFMCIMYLLWEATFTMNDIGYWSMLSSLSSKREQRNNVTMLTVLFAGVGAALCQLLVPMLTPGNAKQAYMFIGIGIAAVFMISQTLAAIFIKETPRTVKEQTEKISVKKMWTVIKKNDQVLWMTLSMLFYNIGSALILGLAYNFYYMEIGYDGNAIFFVLVCGAVNILAQTFYPLLAKHFTRRKIQLVSIITACVGYVGLALMGWTDFFPVTLPLLCLVGAIVFTGQSIFYITSIINMTNCVEYNEYKQGERNEAVVSTLRPFMAKFASALQYGITILVLVVSGIYGLSQNISTLETQKNFFNAMDHGQQKEYIEKVQDYIDELAPYTDTSSKEYLAKVADINKRLESDKLLSGCQIQAEYIKSIGDAKLFNGETSLGRLREIDEDNLPNAVLIFDLTGVDGAANMNFKDIASNDLSMRIWLRMAIAVLPILLLLCALIIQKKKFVINEEYYDKMMVEIDSRHMPTAEVTDTIETAEPTETVEPTVEDNK